MKQLRCALPNSGQRPLSNQVEDEEEHDILYHRYYVEGIHSHIVISELGMDIMGKYEPKSMSILIRFQVLLKMYNILDKLKAVSNRT